MKEKLFKRDFTMVIIGQIISLFGNQILRFALPLYLLKETGSPALFGIISAVSFIPMIVLCPVGGIIADRVNKRNVMVILDFSTAALVLMLAVLLGKVDLVLLFLVVMILLYGIQGAYQPAVQASIPALLSQGKIIEGNAVVNLVSSLAGLLGPVIGGALYTGWGIMPVLYISSICFAVSAIMEIFIRIPFIKSTVTGSVFKIGMADLKESFHFIRFDQPYIWKVSLVIASINLALSAMIMIGLPIIITDKLDFDADTADRFYGYAQGAIAAGSLTGGLLAGVVGKKIRPKFSPIVLLTGTLSAAPIGIVLHFKASALVSYIVIMISCVLIMSLASMFSIQMMSLLQILTPQNLIGKVISCAMCVAMCAQPLGQALFGAMFEWFSNSPYIPIYFSTIVGVIVCIVSAKTFSGLDKQLAELKIYSENN